MMILPNCQLIQRKSNKIKCLIPNPQGVKNKAPLETHENSLFKAKIDKFFKIGGLLSTNEQSTTKR